jgi:hypothetical protein
MRFQPKPPPRYGHASVYVEKYEISPFTMRPTLRKYMYIYGGFSIYCENICNDLWRYEIPYAPYRYYPSNKPLERGNTWSQLFLTDEVSPGKRILHSLVVDKNFKFIYLYGGLSLDDEGNYKVCNDL